MVFIQTEGKIWTSMTVAISWCNWGLTSENTVAILESLLHYRWIHVTKMEFPILILWTSKEFVKLSFSHMKRPITPEVVSIWVYVDLFKNLVIF